MFCDSLCLSLSLRESRLMIIMIRQAEHDRVRALSFCAQYRERTKPKRYLS